MKVVGPQQAPTEELDETGVSVPSGTAQVLEVCMQAEKTLMLLEPELETKRLLVSAAAHAEVAVVTPAQRENAKPPGFEPTCTQ